MLLALVAGSAQAMPDAAALRSALAMQRGTAASGLTRDLAALDALYGDRGAPLWFDRDAPTADARAALGLLEDAARHGLRAQDYGAGVLAAALAAPSSPPSPFPPPAASTVHPLSTPNDQRIARLDVALSLAVVRFLTDLHGGRRDGASALVSGLPAAPAFDAVTALRDALTRHRLDAAVVAAEPALPIYRRLAHLLADYRRLAELPWPLLAPLPVPARPARRSPKAATLYEDVPLLQSRLIALGDLDAPVVTPDEERALGPLADPLRRFQSRHGLAADGVLGKSALAALNVPPAARIEQLELSLERVRRLPALGRGPVIAVNIPSYRLWAFDDPAGTSQLTMPVIVGRAVRTPTPAFVGAMLHIEFNPYWNVPPSILRNEVLPRLKRDPGYLAREEMELVPVRGAGGAVADVDATTLAALAAGTLRVRQRPGARNALDGIKFVLPNTMDIYLHGTPAHGLFARERRDFSHGCIRLADPAALAAFVLRDQPEWTAARIADAMASGKRSVVPLRAPVPVVIFYATAVGDRDGRALFLDDVYAEDRKLDAALRQWSARASAGFERLLREIPGGSQGRSAESP